MKKINRSPENCCKLMRALALSQAGVFVEELARDFSKCPRKFVAFSAPKN